jgi:hypothetical protein
MKTLAAAFITALLVFTLATAWMEMVQPRLDMLVRASTPKADEAAAKSSTKRNLRRSSTAESEDDLSDEEVVKIATKASRKGKSRNEASPSDAMKDKLLAQFEEVRQKEARLVEREDSIRTIYDEIRRELAEVNEIRRQSANELAFAERGVLEATAGNQNNAAWRASEAAKASAKPASNAQNALAATIQNLVKRGNIKDAATLLSGLKDREVAKILGSLTTSDPSIALRISDQIRLAKLQAAKQSNGTQ